MDNIPALVQIMAWRRPGDKPLSEPMLGYLTWRIYVSLGLSELNKSNTIWSYIHVYVLFFVQYYNGTNVCGIYLLCTENDMNTN